MIQSLYLNDVSKINDKTDQVLEFLKEQAKIREIKEIIIPTTSGETALKAIKLFEGEDVKLIIVTHQSGFKEKGEQEVSEEILLKLNNSYAEVVTCQHALAGIGRAVRLQLQTWEFSELAAMVLRTLGQGTKVCAEITLMAADSGKLSMNNDIIAAGGSGHGLDTAWIIKPAHSHQFFDLKLKAVIAKPLNF
ncbi:MAG: pyruvate kinase alpha/beta domain-containing protein [Candidatus Kariarchaeaceae archaeon]